MRSFIGCGITLGCLLVAGSVRAQATTGSTAAEALFDAGRGALEKKDYATACEKFAASNKLEPAVGTVLNLGYCSEMLGRVASAWGDYRDALYQLPPNDSRAAIARERIKALEPRLPYLTVRAMPGSPPGLEVLLDGVQLPNEALGSEVPVDPGSHAVVTHAPGRQVAQFQATVREGEHAELRVGAGEPASATPSASPSTSATLPSKEQPGSPEPARSSPPVAGYVVGAVGLASLAASVITGVMALGKNATVHEHCQSDPAHGGRACDAEGLSAASSGKTLALISDVSLGVGIVGLGVGTTLVLTAGKSPGREGASAASVGLRGSF
jgi:hypothetical protein